MRRKYIDKYGVIWTKSVMEGYVHNTQLGYGLFLEGEGLTEITT